MRGGPDEGRRRVPEELGRGDGGDGVQVRRST